MGRSTASSRLIAAVFGSAITLGSPGLAQASLPSAPNPCGMGARAFENCLSTLSFFNRNDGYGVYQPQGEASSPPAELVTTVDGGSNWSVVGRAPVSPADDISTEGMVFLNRTTGFLFGTSGLRLTHNGGRHWSSVALPGRVLHLTTLKHVVWLTYTSCELSDSATSPCTVGIEESSDLGTTWRRVSLPESPFQAAELAVASNSRFFIGAWDPVDRTGSGELLQSANGGTTWTALPLPCPVGYRLGGRLSLAAATLWMVCDGQGSGGTSGLVIYRSTNEGTTWVPESSYALGGPTGVRGGAPAGKLESFVATSSSTAIALVVNGGLMQSTDGGATWTPAGSAAMRHDLPGFLGTLDVLDSAHMWVATYVTVSRYHGLWRTTNKGVTMKAV